MSIEVGNYVRLSGDKYGAWRVDAVEEGVFVVSEKISPYGRERRGATFIASDVIEVCSVSVPEGWRSVGFHLCAKPVKGEHLCGLHLSARKCAAQRATDEREARERSAQTKEALAALVGRLQVLGFRAAPAWNSRTFLANGQITLGEVTPEQARRLADAMEQAGL